MSPKLRILSTHDESQVAFFFHVEKVDTLSEVFWCKGDRLVGLTSPNLTLIFIQPDRVGSLIRPDDRLLRQAQL